MRNSNIITVNVSAKDIVIDRNEAAMRLKIPRNYENETILNCEKRLKEMLFPKYAFVKTDVCFSDEDICNLGFGNIKSRDLCHALEGCSQAYIFGCTIGIATDRLIKRLSLVSPAESFITDALASAAAEALCEYADNAIRGDGKRPFRFAPGYGDLPLSIQPEILTALDAGQTLGITLNSALLMTPMKSVTAIMGIGDNL